MLIKLNIIILYSIIAFFISLMLYPIYISMLRKIKAWQNIRETDVSGEKAEIFNKLHCHKSWTPTMGWWLFLFVMILLVLISLVFQKMWYISNSLITRQETYIILFAFFSMWILWIIDDFLNIKWIWKIKWMTAKMKLIWMFTFSGFISYWFFFKLGINYINIWPIWWEINLGIFYLLFTFIFTVAIVNAINITDGLDWLAWWLSMMVLFVFMIITFFFWWYLTTTIIWILLGIMLAFLRFNINPAKIFMWDSWALALGWIVSSLIYLVNIKIGIIIPFIILFWVFWIELMSSFLQMSWKKIFKKKIFSIAPFHHMLEHKWEKEHTITMKLRVIQWVLACLTLIIIFYQVNGKFN